MKLCFTVCVFSMTKLVQLLEIMNNPVSSWTLCIIFQLQITNQNVVAFQDGSISLLVYMSVCVIVISVIV